MLYYRPVQGKAALCPSVRLLDKKEGNWQVFCSDEQWGQLPYQMAVCHTMHGWSTNSIAIVEIKLFSGG